MRYGLVLPGGTAPEQLEQALLAEEAGWDGVFVWEASYGVDAWTLLAAMAARTSRVRLGTMLTPLPWRRPWKLASQVVTLDQLSGGRAVLAVGLGAADDALGHTGEPEDRRTRAALLDEGLDVVRGLWEGRLEHTGEHYDMHLGAMLGEVGRPVQDRIPIWVVAAWPREPSMARVLRCDGLLPCAVGEGGVRPATPDEVQQMSQWLRERGARDDLDVVVEGETSGEDPAAAGVAVDAWAAVGATWWLETRWTLPHNSDERRSQVEQRIAAGPPRVIGS